MGQASSAARTCSAARSASEKTATDAISSSRQARAMRTAISPRLAMRTLRMRVTGGGSQRDVAVLARRVAVALVARHVQAGRDLAAGLAGEDLLVHEPAVRGHVGVRELLAELLHLLLAQRIGIGGFGQLAAV